MSRLAVSLAAVAFIVAGLVPIVTMFTRVTAGDFEALFDERTSNLLGRTLLLGAGSAGIAFALGFPFGFLVARTDVPAARLLRPLGLVPLLLPPLMIAMTWMVVAPIHGAWAAIAILGVATFPLVGVFTARAFERIDAGLEDAARLAGGTRAVLRANFGLVLPSALTGTAFAFVFAVNDFSVPDYVTAVGLEKFNVYADEVFASWRIDKSPGDAVATALPLIAMTLVALIPALVARKHGGSTAVSNRFRAPERIRLGAWRLPAFLFCATVVALGAGIPIGRLIWEAGGGSKGFALENLQGSFARALELARSDVQNSLVYAAATATISVVCALVLGHALARARRGRWLEPAVLLPIAVPAVLFGIGYIATWNHAWSANFYDGPGIVILLMSGRFSVFAILVLSGAVAMLDKTLEDAAQLVGASPVRRLTSIVAPALASSIAGAWVLVFVLALRELDAAILVPAANHTAMFRVYNAVHFGRDDFVAAMALLLVFFLVLPGLLWLSFARRRLEVLP